MTRIVHVPLPDRGYDVHIGSGLVDGARGLISPILRRHRVLVMTEDRVAPLWLDRLRAGLGDIDAPALVLDAGEATKSWDRLRQAVEWLLDQRPERGDVVLALGGGVIGDLAGFAAAVTLRGLKVIQVPTSLLSQVDSSVGGKTGINTGHGKNLVGAFHQPSLVLADTQILATLPDRDLRSGYGEIAKAGLLGDSAFFTWLEEHSVSMLAGDVDLRAEAIRRSVQLKADIVLRDERESGDRALLNLGHTFGHALEAATGYSGRLLHGEAVAVGCTLAFDLSAKLGLCSQEMPSRVRAHFDAVGLPRDLSQIPGDLPGATALVEMMGNDKKVLDGRLRFVLATDIGAAFVKGDVPNDAVEEVLSASAA